MNTTAIIALVTGLPESDRHQLSLNIADETTLYRIKVASGAETPPAHRQAIAFAVATAAACVAPPLCDNVRTVEAPDAATACAMMPWAFKVIAAGPNQFHGFETPANYHRWKNPAPVTPDAGTGPFGCDPAAIDFNATARRIVESVGTARLTIHQSESDLEALFSLIFKSGYVAGRADAEKAAVSERRPSGI